MFFINSLFLCAQNELIDNDLQEAIDKYDYSKINSLIKQGVNINAPNVNGFTPLILAITKQDIKLVQFLLEHGADVNYVNKYGNSVLVNSLFTKNQKIIQLLLDEGADINYVNKYNMNVLMYLTSYLKTDFNSYFPIFKLLINHSNLDINKKIKVNGSALHFAVQMGQFEVVKLLLEHNANTNLYNPMGLTPLTLAIQYRKSKIIYLFVQQKKGLEDKTKGGKTPIEFAKESYNKEAIEILEGRQTFDLDNKKRIITVDYIIEKLHQPTTEVIALFDQCQDIKAIDSKYKNNLLFYTISYPILFEELLKRGLNPNTKTNSSGTILHHIASINFNNEKIIPLLQQYQADFEIKDQSGNIPLHYAAKSEHLINCQLLLKYGKKEHLIFKNDEGKTPYDLALESERLNIQYFLNDPDKFEENQIWQVKNIYLNQKTKSSPFLLDQQQIIDKLEKITIPSIKEILTLNLAYHNTGDLLKSKELLSQHLQHKIIQLHLVETLLMMGYLNNAKTYFSTLKATFFENKEYDLAFFHYVDSFISLESNQFQASIAKGRKNIALINEDEWNKNSTYERKILLFNIYEKIGIAFLNLEKSDSARTYFNHTNNSTDIAILKGRFHQNQARLYLHFNYLKHSYKVINHTISIYQKTISSDHPLYLESLSVIADYYLLTQEYAAAEILYNYITKVYRKKQGENSIKYLYTIHKKTILHEHLGNFNKSIELLTTNHEMAKKQGLTHHPFFIDNSLKLADYYRSIDDFKQSFLLTQEAQELILELYGKNNDRYYKTLHNFALIHIFRKEYKAAEQKLLTIQQSINKDNNSFLQHQHLMLHLGVLYQVQQQYTNAINAYLSIGANSINNNYYNPLDVIKSNTNISKIYIQQKKYNKAQERLLLLEQSETERIDKSFPILSENEKEMLYKQTRQGFNLFNTLLVFHHNNNDLLKSKVYDHQLNYKALLLHQSIKTKNQILKSGNEELIRKYKEWKNNQNTLTKSKNIQNLSKIESIEIAKLEKTTELLEKELALLSFEFKKQKSTKITWLDVQKKLEPQDVAIEMIRSSFEDSVYYYALIITPTCKSPEFVLLEDGKNLETLDFKFYKNCIQYQIEDERSYQRYFEKIHQKLPTNTKNIYFSPDGIYNKININTIFIPNRKKFILDLFNVQALTNTKELVETSLRNSSKQPVLFGRPIYNGEPSEKNNQRSLGRHTNLHSIFDEVSFSDLPGTEKEINSITNVLEQQKQHFSVFMGKDATEHNLKQITNPSILHLATHGFFFSDTEKKEAYDENARSFNLLHQLLEDLDQQTVGSNPMTRSGIILTGATTYLQNTDTSTYKEDGIFTAYEALNLSLDQTNLVVLSACETGLGDIVNGEGVYGLQRAFKIAGAQNILMSLWKVDDEATQKLMSYFYNNLSTTQNKRNAFLQAQQQLKKEYPDPYYWGAFILIGK